MATSNLTKRCHDKQKKQEPHESGGVCLYSNSQKQPKSQEGRKRKKEEGERKEQMQPDCAGVVGLTLTYTFNQRWKSGNWIYYKLQQNANMDVEEVFEKYKKN